jgi:beta-N-acetylhexosaminidase
MAGNNEPTLRAWWRRVRSRLPTSPLPKHWDKRVRRSVLGGVVVLVLGGAVASVLIQRGGDDDEDDQGAGAKAAAPVQRAADRLSPVQEVDAVVVSGFANSAAGAKLARSAQLGGLLVGADNWFGTFKGRTMLSRLRAQSAAGGRIPPLIVGVQEGGAYRAYPGLPPALGQREIAATNDPREAAEWAAGTGRALAKAGFDLNLAPIADVATLDSPLADRAFSDDPELVTAMTAGAVRGCRGSGIACATPYFPGVGAASIDTSQGPATVGLDAESLEVRDLAPFRAAIAERVPAVVVSLALYSAYDPVTPGALSPSIVQNLLRDQLRFKGVAISDDLSAGGPALGMPVTEAAVQALAAGIDLVVVSDPGEAVAVRKAVLSAAREGSIPQDRLNEAIARVLSLKQSLGLL